MTQASSCTGDGDPLANAAFRLLEGFVDRHTLFFFNWNPAGLIDKHTAQRIGVPEAPSSPSGIGVT